MTPLDDEGEPMKDAIREPFQRGGTAPGPGPFGRGGPRWEPDYCGRTYVTQDDLTLACTRKSGHTGVHCNPDGRTWQQGAVREPDPEPITLTEWYTLLRRLGHDPKEVTKVVVTRGTIVVTEERLTEHRIEVDD